MHLVWLLCLIYSATYNGFIVYDPYLAKVDLQLLTRPNAEGRHKRLIHVNALEGYFLSHAVHHQFSIQGETYMKASAGLITTFTLILACYLVKPYLGV